ncbi:MAG: RNA-binding S4 domain-containing protein [Clostridiales Family XIII bacterium]|jgi:ribosomal 50S subunit-recycling heat shock protein|nr:RNA-binding S4 domain-containing protein [Clostridiales Family XIII bacterium]
MRLDKYLKVSRIIKRRTIAKDACDRQRVLVNGRAAKAGAEVSVGDEITVRFGASELHVRVTGLAGHTRKEDADSMYEVLATAPRHDIQ